MEVSAEKRNESLDFRTNVDNYGLLDGKMLECIWNFQQSRQVNSEEQLERANRLLDNIAENIFGIDGFDFAKGLAGIGFAIEWLNQNSYIECDTDEVLGEVDDEIYKSVVYSRSTNHSLMEGTIGKAYYFYKRLISANPSKSRYKQICLIECLILLSDELTDYLIDPENGKCSADNQLQITDQDIMNMCHILILFEKILKRRINVEAIKAGICGILGCIDRLCLGESMEDCPLKFLPLVYSHTIVGRLLGDPVWQSKSRLLCGNLAKKSLPDGRGGVYNYMFRMLSDGLQENNISLSGPKVPNELTDLLLSPDDEIAELLLLK